MEKIMNIATIVHRTARQMGVVPPQCPLPDRQYYADTDNVNSNLYFCLQIHGNHAYYLLVL